MHDGGAYTLSLELEAPRLRREAFPWDVAQVQLSAVLSSTPTTSSTAADPAATVAECGRIMNNVRLPSVVDLSALWPPGGAKDCTTEGLHVDREKEHHLEAQILGCDLGITFTLGTASIEVPTQLKPSIAQNACRSTPFRVCLRDDAGARVGTISGAFLTRRGRAMDGSPLVAEHAVAKQSEAGSAAVCGRQGDGDADQGSLLGATKTSEDLAAKRDDQNAFFEEKAIELLDMASKILASTNSPANRRGCNPAACTEEMTKPSAFEHNGAVGSRLLPDQQKQATGLAETIASNDPEDHGSGDDGVSGLPPRDKERETLAPRFPTAGFRFEPTTGSMAWHRIAAVNASKVERDGDLQTLKQFIADVAVGQVDEDDIDANPGLITAFRLAQLQVQYVLHCQQILQRQCDGLQSTTTNMELEVEGNSQSTTAMKNRVRLLRKESRKQDKIISGYATMLRKHNPGLASKVRLDEKGRLRVFRVEEAARECGGGSRRRRGNRSRCDIDGLQVLRVQNREKGSSNNDGSPARSSSPTSDNRSPASDNRDNRSPASDNRDNRSPTSDNRCLGGDRSRNSSTSDNPRARSSTGRSAAGPHADVRRESVRTNHRSMQKNHQREGTTGEVDDVYFQEAFVSEGGGLGDADADAGNGGGSGGSGDGLEPRRNSGGDDNAKGLSRASIVPRTTHHKEGETVDKGESETHPPRTGIEQKVQDKQRFEPPRDLSELPPQVDARDAVSRRGGTHDAIRNVRVAIPNRAGLSGKLGGSIEHSPFSSGGGGDKKGGDSPPGEGWRETERDVAHYRDRPISVGAQPDSKTEAELEYTGPQSNCKKKTEAGLESKDDAAGSRTPRLVTVSVKPRGIRQLSPDSAELSSPRFRGGEDGYASSPGGVQAPRDSAASGAHPAGQGGGRDAGEGGEYRRTHEMSSSTQAGVSRGRRLGEAGGQDRQSSSAAESAFSPSRLGIEGEGYPDALEFDLDDISEIDAGGEWAAGGGEGSLSS